MMAPHQRDNGAVPGGCAQGQVGDRLMLVMEQPEPELICAMDMCTQSVQGDKEMRTID